MYEHIAKIIATIIIMVAADTPAKSPVETSKSSIVNKVLSYQGSSGTIFPFQSIFCPFITPESIKVLFYPGVYSSSVLISVSVLLSESAGNTFSGSR
jgi:hypothetical protein